jgi:hypothetical protein
MDDVGEDDGEAPCTHVLLLRLRFRMVHPLQ